MINCEHLSQTKQKKFKPEFALSTNFKWKLNTHIRVIPSPQVEGKLRKYWAWKYFQQTTVFRFSASRLKIDTLLWQKNKRIVSLYHFIQIGLTFVRNVLCHQVLMQDTTFVVINIELKTLKLICYVLLLLFKTKQ